MMIKQNMQTLYIYIAQIDIWLKKYAYIHIYLFVYFHYLGTNTDLE